MASTTYRIIGDRWIRKYTASDSTPVYASESDVNHIATHLCDVPWESANGVRKARMTWHTDDIVHTEGTGSEAKSWSGLDWNVEIRDEFDAALFCAHHTGGGHRAYANAAAYVYKIPQSAVGLTLQRIAGIVTSDPYNVHGARIAVLTNHDGVLPTDCFTCRNGGVMGLVGYTYDNSYHSTTDNNGNGVAPRTERTTSAGTSWFPTTATWTLNPANFVLQEYLVIFIVLENYNTSRGNWIEGSSFLENLVSITLSDAASSGLDTSVDNDLTAVSGSSFNISNPVGTAIQDGGTSVVMYETTRLGYKGVDRALVHKSGFSGHYVQYNSSGSRVTTMEYQDAFPFVSYGQKTVFGSGYHNTGSLGDVPRIPIMTYVKPGNQSDIFAGLHLSVFLQTAAGYGTVQQVAMTTDATVPVSSPAYDALLSGEVNSVRFAGDDMAAFTSHVEQDGGISRTYWTVAVPVIVCCKSGAFIVGFVSFLRRGKTGNYDNYKFYFADHDLANRNLCSHDNPYYIGRMYYMGPEESNSSITLNNDGTASLTEAFFTKLANESCHFYAVDTANGMVIKGSGNNTGFPDVSCVGTNIRVYLYPTDGMTSAASWTTLVITGKLVSVGGVECSTAAVVPLFGANSLLPGGYSASDIVVSLDAVKDKVQVSGGVIKGVGLLSGYMGPTYPTRIILTGTFTSVDGVSCPEGICSLIYTISDDAVSDVARLNLDLHENEVYMFYFSKLYGLLSFPNPIACTVNVDLLSNIYATTPFDTDLMVTDSSASVIGLRNVYGNLFDKEESGRVYTGFQRGVGFRVYTGTRNVSLSGDGGLTVVQTQFPVWRIVSSVYFVPFSFPWKFPARKVRVSWNYTNGALSVSGSGAYVNMWFKEGPRDNDMSDDMSEPDLYTSASSDVSGWKFIGKVLINSTNLTGSVEFDLPSRMNGISGTFLFTAFVPPENIEIGNTSTSVGIGNITISGDGVVSDGEGWKPTIALLP